MADAASLEKQLSSNSTILLVYHIGTKNIIMIPAADVKTLFRRVWPVESLSTLARAVSIYNL